MQMAALAPRKPAIAFPPHIEPFGSTSGAAAASAPNCGRSAHLMPIAKAAVGSHYHKATVTLQP